MSDMVDVINRLESWVRNYGHEKQPAFIADLQALIGIAKAAQRAAKIALGDDLILCLQGVEYPIGRVSGLTFLRADTETVKTVHGDGTSSIRPVQTVTKIELECTQPAMMEPIP